MLEDMSEQDPNHDDTQRIPTGEPGPEAPHTHRYGETTGGAGGRSDTAVYDTQGWETPPGGGSGPWQGGSSFYGAPYQPPTQPPRRRGVTAGVLVAALVLGGLAGLGGAAVYDLVDGDSAASGDTGRTTTTVVEREDTPASEGSVQAVAESVLPSVVKIDVRTAQGAGSGSGVVISADGEILTNHHVVDAAQEGGTVSVGFDDGSTASARVVGTDPLTDLAIIQAEDASGLTPATLGRSRNLDVGEQVVAIGSPFGLDASVTRGSV